MKKHNPFSQGVTRRDVLGVPLAMGAAALWPSASWAATQVKGGTLRAVANINATSLDPHTGGGGADFIYLNPLYNTLIEYVPDTLEPRPGLAESWEWTNPTTLTLKLRQNIQFHDGTPFDAAAVKANFEHIATSSLTTTKVDTLSVKSVETDGQYRVVFKLIEPDISFLMALTDRIGMMSSPKALAKYGNDYNRNPVGTGPMQFVRWDDNDKVLLTRNKQYWKPGQPVLDDIVITVITDPGTALRAVMSGQQDWVVRIDPQQLPVVRRTPNVRAGVFNTLRLQQCYINFSRPPLNDVRLRQALNYAIDRVAFTKIVLAGVGEPANTHIPKAHWAYDAQAAARYPYDPDKARALVKEVSASGVTINANYWSDQLSAQRMDILASFWGKVGINLTRTVGSAAFTLQKWRENVGDIRMAAWNGRPDPSLNYSQLFSPESTFNIGGAVPSPDLLREIKTSRTVELTVERKAAMAKVLRLEREFALSIPLCFEPEINVYSAKVQEFQSNLIGRPRLEEMYRLA